MAQPAVDAVQVSPRDSDDGTIEILVEKDGGCALAFSGRHDDVLSAITLYYGSSAFITFCKSGTTRVAMRLGDLPEPAGIFDDNECYTVHDKDWTPPPSFRLVRTCPDVYVECAAPVP